MKARVAKIEALRSQFNSVDTDGSGFVDAEELGLAMALAGAGEVTPPFTSIVIIA